LRGFSLTGRWVAVAIVFVTLVSVSTPHFHLYLPKIEQGAIWTGADLYSPFAFTVRAESVPDAERQRIENRYEKVFKYDGGIKRQALQQVAQLIDLAKTHAASRETTGGGLQHEAVKAMGLHISPETAQTILRNATNGRVPSDL